MLLFHVSDPHYTQSELDNQLRTFGDGESVEFCPFSVELFISVLGRIRSTSPGPDEIAFWLYKTCAVELGQVVAKLVSSELLFHTAGNTSYLENCKHYSCP